MNRLLFFLLLFASLAVRAEEKEETIRICDDSGCSDRPKSSATFTSTTTGEDERRIAALTDMARKDARAAYDLGLRFFRGDGVRQDSYQALQWMRDAAERGDVIAQLAVGRFYLMGLEEMGSDPAEAEKWLLMAAGRGNKEAKKLLSEAQAAKKKDREEYKRWVEWRRADWYGYWLHGYLYRVYWRNGYWYYY